MEKIVETRTCKQCSKKFDITEQDIELYNKISPVIKGKKYDIPLTTKCYLCMEQIKLAWKNERKLYKRKCDITGKEIISMFSPDKKIKVYDYKLWNSDVWEASNYGFHYCESEIFFNQFSKLLKDVPFKSLFIAISKNSDFNNMITNCNNCYMCFGNTDLENTFFSDSSISTINSAEVLWSDNIENSYEIVDCNNIYKSYYLNLCSNTNNSFFCYNINNCDFCFMCSGIENKKYYILNIKYSKDDYEKKVGEYLKDPNYVKNCLKIFNDFNLKIFKRALNASNNNKCIGNNVYDSKNCINVFNIIAGENIRNSSDGGRLANVLSSYVCYDGEGLIYDSIDIISSYRINNSAYIYFSQNISYSYYMQNCKNCFGCVGLKNKEYYILNKEYSNKEYNELVPKIIEKMKKNGEWGEFFPSSISPFGYNETIAMEEYALSKKDAKEKGFNWSDYITPFPKVKKIIPGNKLPNSINDIPNDILNWAIKCEISKKPFKIVKAELEFYRKHNLPVPKRHPDQRHLDRIKQRNPRKLFDRKCDKCNIEIKTTFSQDREEIVYCEKCYNKEIY